MLLFYLRREPLSLSLFYPRWLLDGPIVVQSWKMSLLNSVVSLKSKDTVNVDIKAALEAKELVSPGLVRHVPYENLPVDRLRYQDHSEQLIIDDSAKIVETLRSLPAGQKEEFATGFHYLTIKLQARTDDFIARREAMPAKLPDPPPKPNVLFTKKRPRGYTRREATEENKKDTCRAQRQAKRDAKDRRTC
jgi:hypothetical protein